MRIAVLHRYYYPFPPTFRANSLRQVAFLAPIEQSVDSQRGALCSLFLLSRPLYSWLTCRNAHFIRHTAFGRVASGQLLRDDEARQFAQIDVEQGAKIV